MKLENLATLIEDARKNIAQVNVGAVKLATINEKELPEGFVDGLEKSANGLSKMLITMYKEIDYKIPFEKYTKDNASKFCKQLLSIKDVHSYDTEIMKLIGTLNGVAALLRKFNNKDDKREYQVIVTKANTFIKLKKPYFTAHKAALGGLESAIATFVKEEEK